MAPRYTHLLSDSPQQAIKPSAPSAGKNPPSASMRSALIVVCIISLSEAAAALRYTPSDLEMMIGTRFVQAMDFDFRGRAWVSTQRGLHIIDDSAISSLDARDKRPDITHVRNIISIGALDQVSMYAVTKDGQIVSFDTQTRQYSSKLIADIHGRISGDPVLHERHIYFNSNGVLSYKPLEKDRDHYSVGRREIRIPERVLTSESLAALPNAGVCAGYSEVVLCGLSADSSHNPLILYRGMSGETIRFLLPLEKRNQLLIVLETGKLVFASATRSSPPEEHHFKALETNPPRVLGRWKSFILFGTDDGVFSLDIRTKEIVSIDVGRLKRVTGFVTQSYGVWVLTESGVFLLSDSQIGFWPQDFKSFPKEVLSISKFGNGIYAGTYSGIFDIENSAREPVVAWSGSLNSVLDRRVTAMTETFGMLAAGTFSGQLHFFRAVDGKLVRSKTVQFESGASSIASVDDALIVGTGNHGLFVISNDTKVQVAMPLSWERQRSPITAIERSSGDGEVIFLTEYGVGVLCAHEIETVCGYMDLPESASESIAVATSTLDDGSIFIGSLYGGLFRTSVQDIVRRKPIVPVLPSIGVKHHIYTMDNTNPRDLWIGTDNGVVMVDLESGVSRHFGQKHGMINKDINHGASFLSGDGTYFVGGLSGIDRIPRLAKYNGGAAPQLRLLSVKIRGSHFGLPTAMEQVSRIVLSSSDATLELRVSLADYRDLSETTYSFFLEGWDEQNKTSSGSGIVQYTNLPPGNYTFKARGADAFGVWSDNEITVPITVLPPPWRAWWALLAYALTAGLLFFVARRAYRNHLLRTLRIERAEEEARALARLEDEWQEQREANERLLQSITPSTQALLRAVEVALRAENDDHGGEARNLEKPLQMVEALERQQELVSRSNAGSVCSLQALVEELAASVAAAQPPGHAVIIVNESPDATITARHAQYLTLVVLEVLSAVVARSRAIALEEPIVHVSVLPPGYGDEPVETFVLLIEDRNFPVAETEELEDALSVTTQLLQIFPGAVEIERDLGLQLRVELALDDLSAS